MIRIEFRQEDWEEILIGLQMIRQISGLIGCSLGDKRRQRLDHITSKICSNILVSDVTRMVKI